MTGSLLERDRSSASGPETEEDVERHDAPRATVPWRRHYAKALRIAFVAALAWLVLAGGVGFVALVRFGLGDAPSSGASENPTWPDDEAKAFAARFAQTVLTYSPSPKAVDARTAAIQAMVSSEVDAERVAAVPEGTRQRVLGTWPAGGQRHGSRVADIVVAATVSNARSTSTLHLSVPVARDAYGGLVVDAYPAPVSPPAAAQSPPASDVSLDDANADAIEALLKRFLPAYLSGGATAPEFLAPGVTVVPLGRRYINVNLVSTALDGPAPASPTAPVRHLLVVVEAVDLDTRALVTARYRMTVVCSENDC